MIDRIKNCTLSLMRKQDGFSLIESIIGVAILGIFALVITDFSNIRTLYRKKRSIGVCEQAANTYMTKLQFDGHVTEIADTFVSSGSGSHIIISSDLESFEIQDSSLISKSSLWKNDFSHSIIDTTTTPLTTLRNSLLVNGALRGLAAFYNNYSNISALTSNTGVADSALEGLVDLSEIDLIFDQVRFRMVPVNLSTGVENTALPSPIIFRPIPRNSNNVFSNGWFQTPTLADHGMKVQIFIDYYEPRDTSKTNMLSCFSTKLITWYQAPAITNPPNVSFANPHENYSGFCPSLITDDVTLTIGYSSNLPKGSLFLCKERSTQKILDVLCYGGHGESQWDGRSFATAYTADWTPCAEAKLCGVSPATPSWTPSDPSSITDSKQLTLTYSDMPLGCEMIMDVIVVDPSGNYITEIARSEVEAPPCGYLCSYQPGWGPQYLCYDGSNPVGYRYYGRTYLGYYLGGYYNCLTSSCPDVGFPPCSLPP